MTTQWEYVAFEVPVQRGIFSGVEFDPAKLVRELNIRGKDGWELASSFAIDTGGGGGTKSVVVVMKRAKS